MSADDKLLTRREVGDRLRLSEWAVGKLIRRGELAEHRFSPRRSYVSEADLQAYVDAHRKSTR